MKTLPIFAALLLIAGCRSNQKVQTIDAAKSVEIVKVATTSDSISLTYKFTADSPQIVVEYIDSPRRIVAYRARQVKVEKEKTEVVAATNDSTATASEQVVADTQETPCPTATHRWHWGMLVLILAGVALKAWRNHSS